MSDKSLSTKNLINELNDVANWDKYLEIIYLTLHDIAEDFYKQKYPDDTKTAIFDRYNPGWRKWTFLAMGNRLVEYKHREIIETIVYVLLAETVYLTSKNPLFNDLKLQNDSNDSENKAIMDAIKDKFTKINNDCRDFINCFLMSTEGLGVFDDGNESVKKYIENVFSRDKDKSDELMGKFRSVVIRLLCLKCYSLYKEEYREHDWQWIENKCPITFEYLFKCKDKYVCDCFDIIANRGNLKMFISNVEHYDIRQARFGNKVFDKILQLSNEDEHKFENFYFGWVTPKQKRQYIKEAEQKYTQYRPKLGTKDDNNIYNNSHVLKGTKKQEKAEQPQQEHSKRCQIF